MLITRKSILVVRSCVDGRGACAPMLDAMTPALAPTRPGRSHGFAKSEGS